jgi:hypothetical protein
VKRPKLSSLESDKGQATDSDFARLFESKREYRRQMLGPLSKTSPSVLQNESTKNKNLTVISDLATSSDVEVQSSDSGNKRKRPDITPDTSHSSLQFPSKRTRLNHKQTSTPASASEVSSLGTQILFDNFVNKYQDYKGNKAQFDTAFALLKSLRRNGKAPHPFLFDDFVFHHFHNYRSYIISCFDSGEKPVEYSEFFNDQVSSLDHNARIITTDQVKDSKSDRSEQSTGRRVSTLPSSPPKAFDHASLADRRTLESLTEDQNQLVEKSHPKKSEGGEMLGPSQKSSVESWLQDTARAGSPELGTLEVRTVSEQNPEPEPEPETDSRKESTPVIEPRIQLISTEHAQIQTQTFPASKDVPSKRQLPFPPTPSTSTPHPQPQLMPPSSLKSLSSSHKSKLKKRLSASPFTSLQSTTVHFQSMFSPQSQSQSQPTRLASLSNQNPISNSRSNLNVTSRKEQKPRKETAYERWRKAMLSSPGMNPAAKSSAITTMAQTSTTDTRTPSQMVNVFTWRGKKIS